MSLSIFCPAPVASAAAPAATTLAHSRAVLTLGGERAGFGEWVQRGRRLWEEAPDAPLHGLRGVLCGDALALLAAALVDGKPLLLAPADAERLAGCNLIAEGFPGDTIRWVRADGEIPWVHRPSTIPGEMAVCSSGTLGSPKTIWHRTRSMLATAQLAADRLRLDSGEKVLIAAPLHHLYGLGAGLIAALLRDADVRLLPKANLLSFGDALRECMPAVTFATPHLLRAALERGRTRITGARCAISAGDAMSSSLRELVCERFGGAIDLYGSSELGVIATDDGDAGWMRPLPGVVASPRGETGQDLSRLYIAHPNAAGRIEHEGRLIEPGFPCDTGDLAHFRADGRFRLAGRADLSLNRAGRLLVLAEVEAIAAQWPGVLAATAVLLERETAIGRGFALIVEAAHDAPETDLAWLRRQAHNTLPVFARPDAYRVTTCLPRLANGKPDRRTLQEEYRFG